MRKTGVFAAMLFLVFAPLQLYVKISAAQNVSPNKTRFGPYKFRTDRNNFLLMRDGVRLVTDIYFPLISDGSHPSPRSPVVLIRTGYGNVPGNNYNDAYVRFFTSHGYIVAVQDVRGRYRSEGDWELYAGDTDDAFDTIDWLSKQAWTNGRIGMIGCSYLGDETILGAASKHPALKAVIPQSSGMAGRGKYAIRPGALMFNGVMLWGEGLYWYSLAGRTFTPRLAINTDRDAYSRSLEPFESSMVPKALNIDLEAAYWHLPMKDALRANGGPPTEFENLARRGPADPNWQKTAYVTDGFTSDVPSLQIGAWYDLPTEALAMFNHFRTHSLSDLARRNQYAVLGPGTHCNFEGDSDARTVGNRYIGDNQFDWWGTYLTWFDAWLKEDSHSLRMVHSWPAVRYFHLGEEKWEGTDQWPVINTRFTNFFLNSDVPANSAYGGGKLSLEVPSNAGEELFVYNPDVPVPTLGGTMFCKDCMVAAGGSKSTGPVDQRPIEVRNDVLVFTSQTIDQPIDATGPAEVRLFVSSDAIDTDFTAKLTDVYPDGRSFNIRESIARARFREGFNREVWMAPGGIYQITVPLGDISNYFKIGHRIRLEVSSSNFPQYERNMNVGGVNAEATLGKIATNHVYHSSMYPSRLILPIVAH